MTHICRQLIVWQRAMDLMVESYRVAKKLPESERFGMTNQIQRAALSIPANIAEGNARAHRREYLRFLNIARGSHAELGTLFEAARRVGVVTDEDLRLIDELHDHVGRLLNRLITRLSESPG